MEAIHIVVAGPAAPFVKKTMSWLAKDGRHGVNSYDSSKFASWKDHARVAAGLAMADRPPLMGPLVFRLKVYFQIAESTSIKHRRLMEEGLMRPTRTPDCDNLMKAAGDAMTGIAIRDDKYIVECRVEKFYSERPRVEIWIAPLAAEPGAPLFDGKA